MPTEPSPSRGDVTVEEAGPPLPDLAFRVINPVVRALLRSPLHWLLSDSLVLLTFTGRRTGTEYSIPVGYRYLDETMVVFTHSPWWRNLRGDATVSVVIQGERRTADAHPISDPDAVAEYLSALIDEHGVEAANRIGLSIQGEGAPTVSDIVDGIEDTVVIELTLHEAPDDDG